MEELKKRIEKIKTIYKNLSKGWKGTLFHIFLGIILALIFNQILAFALNTDLPVVAVYSQSMEHKNAEVTHYAWLEKKFGYSRDFINSWPFPNGLEVGDMPIVAKVDEYEIGDIIVYSAPNQKYPIIHRIVAINEDGTYQTKGDNNPGQLSYELRIKKEQIHGKVIFIIPKLGYFKVLAVKFLEVIRSAFL